MQTMIWEIAHTERMKVWYFTPQKARAMLGPEFEYCPVFTCIKVPRESVPAHVEINNEEGYDIE